LDIAVPEGKQGPLEPQLRTISNLLAPISLLATLLPLAQKGGVGVGIPTLIEFMRVSPVSIVGPALYLLGLAWCLLALAFRQRAFAGQGTFLLILSSCGIVASVLGINEALSHIDLFGGICRSVPALNTAIGPATPAIGGYLLLGIYLLGFLLGMKSSSSTSDTPTDKAHSTY